ncbi:MAG: UDP-N-acetylmuramate--L-alanine ligase [Candidatus Saganbacteria bacterium]|nr:UDP-N-acetylmuramate--L-alanine ligase [Candidatus Saganbacteria bacterium]
MKQFDMTRAKNIHLIGVGGCGVGAIAKILIEMGYKVSGSDLKESANTIRLREMGAHIFFGHAASNVREADIVVYSSAISKENPELAEAGASQIKTIARAEMLSWILSQSKTPIAIAGTHGKTTTTSMTSLVFTKCGFEPTFLIGGETNDVGGNAKLGSGRFAIAEADESDGSFLFLRPKMSVITNIEADHLDHYSGIDSIMETFRDFADLLPPDGHLIICADHPNNKLLLKKIETEASTVLYGFSEDAQIKAKNMISGEGSVKFEVLNNGRTLGEVKLNVPGSQNVENALASIAVGLEAGIDFMSINTALRCFTGVRRRFQLIGKVGGILIYDDYAHHPTEIAVTLRSAKQSWSTVKRLICVFQPHRYSRTMHLKEDFGKAFGFADEVIITDIYSAGENPISGITGETIVEEIRKNKKNVLYLPKKQEIADHLINSLKEGDLVLTMGAGDIHVIAKEIYSRLREKQRNEKLI